MPSNCQMGRSRIFRTIPSDEWLARLARIGISAWQMYDITTSTSFALEISGYEVTRSAFPR